MAAATTRLGLVAAAVAAFGCGEVVVPPEQPDAIRSDGQPTPDAGSGIDFRASVTTVDYLGSATLTWSAASFTSCNAGGSWAGPRATAGTQSTGTLTGAATYSLTCGPGDPGTAIVTVLVSNPLPSPTQPLTGCTMPTDPPYSSCGVYDPSNQVFCSCYRAGQTTELFFSSASDRDHWLSVYPQSVVTFTGPTQYSDTLDYMIRL